MRLPNVKQDLPKHAICGGMQRFVREKRPKWCAEESESSRPKMRMIKRFMARKRMREGQSVGWNTTPSGGVCISTIKCVVTVRKEDVQDIQWMVFVRKQTLCFSSMPAFDIAVQGVFQDGEKKWSLSKKQSKAREG